MDRNDLLGLLILSGTVITITYLMTEASKVIGWGAV